MILHTLRSPARRDTKVLGSRFISEARPVDTEPEARAAIETLRREFPDATHHAWALRLRLPDGERELSSDDGEPAGTAGVPILQALRGAEASNAVVVVVRYFGGTKLGKGGLARAYRDAARAAVLAAGLVAVVPVRRLSLSGPLALDGEVRHLVVRHGGRLTGTDYPDASRATLAVECPASALERLREDLARQTRGAWNVVTLDG